MFDRLKKVFAARNLAASRRLGPGAPPAGDTALDVNAYATCVHLPAIDFPHCLEGARNHLDPDLAPHLDGFAGYVASRGDGTASSARDGLQRHIRRTRWHANLIVGASHAEDLGRWAAQANAILFMADGSVRDPQARILLARDGSGDADASLPAPDEARSRRARTDAALAAAGLVLAPPQPFGAAAFEVQLRAPAEVVQRALALLLVSERTQAPCQKAPMPSEDECKHIGCAHEALAVLAWALMRADGPAVPVLPRDPAQVNGIALRLAAESRVPRQLRPVDEILDALDLHVRASDALRAAGAAGRDAPPTLYADVLSARLRALEWLVRADEPRWPDADGAA